MGCNQDIHILGSRQRNLENKNGHRASAIHTSPPPKSTWPGCCRGLLQTATSTSDFRCCMHMVAGTSTTCHHVRNTLPPTRRLLHSNTPVVIGTIEAVWLAGQLCLPLSPLAANCTNQNGPNPVGVRRLYVSAITRRMQSPTVRHHEEL
jgi:hypothetical protein